MNNYSKGCLFSFFALMMLGACNTKSQTDNKDESQNQLQVQSSCELKVVIPEAISESTDERYNDKDAFTMILDAQVNDKGDTINVIYFYDGPSPFLGGDDNFIDSESGAVIANPIQREMFVEYNDIEGSIRAVLHKRNEQVLSMIEGVKQRWRNNEITDQEYDSIAKVIRTDASLSRPKVNIMFTNNVSWESVLAALDEMQINQIEHYRLTAVQTIDSIMIARYQLAEL